MLTQKPEIKNNVTMGNIITIASIIFFFGINYQKISAIEETIKDIKDLNEKVIDLKIRVGQLENNEFRRKKLLETDTETFKGNR